jgi:predicted ATPase/DNA-binding CsgD family transcriptional regulator
MNRQPASFPSTNVVPLRAAPPRRPHNLPAQPTPLIGREADLAAAADRLSAAEVRLLTLTGPGGVGKTRLAFAVAARLLDTFEHGAFVVSLAPLRDANLVVPTIAHTLGVPEAAGAPPLERLIQVIQERQLLLVLDNFEHVLAAAPAVAELLGACPDLKVLATSRTPLRLRWESVLPVPPLALPAAPAGPRSDLAALAAAPAVALFIERARAVQPAFALTERNAAAVAELCTRLDGLPLAIELAAARISVLTPEELRAQLDRRLALLTGGPRDAPARHQTLRDAIAWSHDLLSPSAQRLFRRLAVFAGGCTPAGAAAVAAPDLADDAAEGEVLEGLAALVDASLLRQEESADGASRFVMLETVREYAREQLDAAGEAELMQERHLDFVCGVAAATDAGFLSPEGAAWMRRLDAEIDNIRAALAWALTAPGRVADGLRLASAPRWFWHQRSRHQEGRRWLAALLARADGAPPAIRAQALTTAGLLAYQQSGPDAAADLLEQSVPLCRVAGAEPELAWAVTLLGFVRVFQGAHDQARALLAEGVERSRALGDQGLLADVIIWQGLAHMWWGEDAAAQVSLEENVALLRGLGARPWQGFGLGSLGRLAQRRGDLEAARRYLEESVARFRESGDTGGLAVYTDLLGELERQHGDERRAAVLFGESLRLTHAFGRTHNMMLTIARLAGLAQARGQRIWAARLAGAAAAQPDTMRDQLQLPDRTEFGRILAAAEALRGEPATAAAWAAGAALTPEQATAEALAVAEALALSDAPSPDEGTSAPALPSRLTARELEVLRLLASGASNQAIAEHLVLSVKTVERHIANIYAKIGAHGRVDAATFAHQHGLLEPDRPPST